MSWQLTSMFKIILEYSNSNLIKANVKIQFILIIRLLEKSNMQYTLVKKRKKHCL